MMKNSGKKIDAGNRTSRRVGLRKLLSGFLAVATAVSMLGGSAASMFAEEASTEYALAGVGSGQDVTVHFGDSEDQEISIHVNPETNEDVLAGYGTEALGTETEADADNTTGIKEVEAGEFVTISPVDGSDLPEEAEADAAIVEGEEAIAAVETKVEEEGTTDAESGSSEDSGKSDNAQPAEKSANAQSAGNVEIANAQYQVFDISLDNVDTEEYEDGFKVSVNLPDDIKGAHDFHLYHLHEGEEPQEIDLTTVGSVEKKTGLEVVSGFEFVTEGFSEFVLKYTVDFYYDVDGKTLEYHIVGGSVQSLRELLQILNIVVENPATEDDELTVFMNNIENVTFSDESLVKPVCVSEDITAGAIIDALGKEVEYSAELSQDDIEKIRAFQLTAPDWALVSLKPFLTEESLAITLKNGEVVTIKVTDDAQDPSIYVGKQVIIYDNAEQRAMTADLETNQWRTQFNTVPVNDADANQSARWTVEYSNGSYYLKSYNGKYLKITYDDVALVGNQNAATPLVIEPGRNPDYNIRDKNNSGNVLTYCLNGNYDGFFSAPGGTYGGDNNNHSWLYIREANITEPNQFSVDVATWTSWGQRWGNLSSKYFGVENNQGKSGDRYPASGTTAGKLGDDKKTYFNYGVGAGPYEGYEFAFWTYQENGLYRQLSSITYTTVIPYNPTEYYAYFTPKGKRLFIYQSEDTSKGTVNQSYGYSDWQSGATATPNQGYQFSGWYNDSGQLVSLDRTFSPDSVAKSMVLTARFIAPGKVNINISVNDSNGGDVVVVNNGQETSYLGDRQTKDNGQLDRTITAKAKDGYVFCYWTINGKRVLLDSDVLSWDPSKGPTPCFQEGDRLQAVFMPSHTIDANGNAYSTISVGTEKKEEFERWLKSLREGKTLSADKSAQVHNYNDRIYQVDINAESARVNPSGKIGMAFILDASNSMQFPANIEKIQDLDPMVLTQSNLNRAFPNESGPLYFISDPTQTSTMYRLYKEDGFWYAVDASYSDPDKIIERRYLVDWNMYYADVNDKNNVPLAYPIYRDKNMGKRVDYLNTGMQNTIDTLRSIVNQVNKSDYDIMVADTMFAAYTKNLHKSGFTPPAGFQWYDFRSLKEDFTVNMGDTDGGTRQDLGLQDALDFDWEKIPEDQRYAILITDGAAVIGGGGKTWDDKDYDGVQQNIVAQADALKAKGVKLITVGLSTKNVVGGSNVMRNIASVSDNGQDKLFFEAESGEDLENILYEIVQTIVKNGTSCGQITDEVDEAFYPVLEDGTPIWGSGQPVLDGTWYFKMGENGVTQINAEEYNNLSNWIPRFKWEETNGKWKITWEHQYIGWNPTDSDPHKHPWKGTFYLKAKENFLGGNKINTNGDCTVVEDGFTFSETLTENLGDWTLHGNDKPTVNLPTPYVNVDELALTDNSTEWTVYLGQEVNPKAQINDLYSKIDVLKVVSGNTNDTCQMIGNKDQMLHGKNITSSERFKLVSVPGLGNLTEEDWKALISNGQVSKPYGDYGHSQVGNIQIKLTPIVIDGEAGLNQNPHATEVVGSKVEQYRLTVTYVPNPIGEGEPNANWHTTPNGSAGDETGSMTSTNEHVINVFDKSISIEKTDTSGNKITDNAAIFKLYRSLNSGETSSEKITVDNEEISVIQVGDEIVTANGKADLPRLPVGATYYLVETEAPEGYAELDAPIEIQMNLANAYWAWNQQESDAADTLQDALKPYNWKQTVSISCADSGWDGNTYHLKIKNQRSVDIEIEKIDESKRAQGMTPLTGARFKLMKWDGTIGENNGEVSYIKFNEEYGLPGGVPVDSDGKLTFSGLPDGEYQIVETSPPAGYIKVDNEIYFTLKDGVTTRHSVPAFANGKLTWDTTYDQGDQGAAYCVTYVRASNGQGATFIVGNTPGAVLPATGGTGTRFIYLLGSLLLLLAGGMLLLQRRKVKEL